MPSLDINLPSNRAADSRGAPPTVQFNRPMALGDRPAVPAAYGVVPVAGNGRLDQADTRNDYRRDYRSNYPPAGTPGMNPLMPDLNREPLAARPPGQPASAGPPRGSRLRRAEQSFKAA